MPVLSLKIIAVTAMLADHIGHVFPDLPFALLLRMIGRLAFPVFAFLIAEGYRHTKDVRRYALRLLTLAVISEIPFDLAVNAGQPSPVWIDFRHQNVFFTLFLGLCAVWALDRFTKLRRPYIGWLIMLSCAVLAQQIHADFGTFGVAVITVFYYFRGDHRRIAAAFCSIAAIRFLFVSGLLAPSGSADPYSALLGLLSVFALPLIFAHNGKKGYAAKSVQWGFYWFYPVHLLFLFLIKQI
jgi:hypothetical protein